MGPGAPLVRPVLIQAETWLRRPPYAGPVPHMLKQRVIREYAGRFRLRTLVETGTYMGDMVWAMRNEFDDIYSIELDLELHAKAVRRFRARSNVHLYRGDSAAVLDAVLDLLAGPALFWLDGHYSAGVTARSEKDTPVLQEVGMLLSCHERGHVILIDDARCFGHGDYPSLAELGTLVGERPELAMEVADDIIRIAPALQGKS